MMQFGLGSPRSALMLLLACLAVCAVAGLIVRLSIKGHAAAHMLPRDTR